MSTDADSIFPHIPVSSLSALAPPSQKIKTEEDVQYWKETVGYGYYLAFIRLLSDAVVGCQIADGELESLRRGDGACSVAIRAMLKMLDEVDSWIDDIPVQESPQRFGNLAFRTWGKKLEDNADTLLLSLLPPALHPSVPFLSPYLTISFGSFLRLDYGTGHEAAFALLLTSLTLLRFFDPTNLLECRQIVLTLFLRYMQVCWRLQDVYKLEPAGSHGVWGLDDSSFLGYVWGSAQLRDQTDIPPTSILHPPLRPTNLYNFLISRILFVKTGPFHEHSSQLYAIATSVKGWAKVHSGLVKMYQAEVLGKRVVVQHLPLGGLISWERVTPSSSSSLWSSTTRAHPALTSLPTRTTTSTAYHPTTYTPTITSTVASGPGPLGQTPTRAPWASSSSTSAFSLNTAIASTTTFLPPEGTLPMRWPGANASANAGPTHEKTETEQGKSIDYGLK